MPSQRATERPRWSILYRDQLGSGTLTLKQPDLCNNRPIVELRADIYGASLNTYEHVVIDRSHVYDQIVVVTSDRQNPRARLHRSGLVTCRNRL